MTNYAESQRAGDSSNILSIFKPLSQFEEQEAKWLVNGWIPAEQVTLLASDGGVGKTTVSCNIAAAISNGGQCILDGEDVEREPQRVLILTTEDSISKKLKKKLRLAGANLENILAPDPSEDGDGILRSLKFGSKELEHVIEQFRPALCIFDPIQGYIPSDVNMCARNQMRNCLSTLITLGERTGCTFLVVCHSNKRNNASGRNRISDSSDLWDISRSVIMAGFTNEGDIRYLSNEKNNYTELQKSVLFHISDDGQPVHDGFSDKHDKDFVRDSMNDNGQPSEPFNERLYDALLQERNPFEAVRFHYSDFEKKYGKTIYGGKQAKRALELMKPYMEDKGYTLVIKQIKVNGKNGKGFVIQPVTDGEPEQLAV